ncbi:hypothetical protein [Actinomadura macra]|uniref:hypothetical protein n=1 Tax=Actinomadura macra TaxID=46164 RepID=UPI0008298754|nr:hypothetical protein [Actinomadura macra]
MRTGRRRAARHLDALAVELESRGWRLVRYYRPTEFPAALPLLRVYAGRQGRDVGMVISVRAARRKACDYVSLGQGPPEFLIACGNAKAAADRIDDRLKHQMYPHTFPHGSGQRS